MFAIAREDFLKISLLLTKSGRVFFVILQIYRNMQKAKKNAFKQKNHPKICVIQKKAVLLQPLLKRGCHRITVSTQDFHSCNRGSIPLGTTK